METILKSLVKPLLKSFLIGAGLIIFNIQAAQSVIVWSGGITQDERDSAPDSGSKLEFFVTSGSYLSNVTVSVKDANNREIVNTVTKGPWLILNLDPGRYTVQAERVNGDTQGGMIEVSDSKETFAFMFPGE